MPLPLVLHQLFSPKATTADVVKSRKAAAEVSYTKAQQRAHVAYDAARAEFEHLARLEFEAIDTAITFARERLVAILATEALPTEVADKAQAVHETLTTKTS